MILIVGVMVPVIAQGAVVKAINCGRPEYTDRAITYAADLPPAQLAIGGSPYSNIHPIAGTTVEPLYQAERFGEFSYKIDGLTPQAWYLVTLKFAEIYQYIYQRARKIAVDIEGKRVITGLDLDAQFGLYHAYDFFVTL